MTALGETKQLIDRFFYPDPSDLSLRSPTHPSKGCNGFVIERIVNRDFILSLSAIYAGFGVGPGASIGAAETDLFSKLATSDLSATDSSLHALYMQAVSSNPTWLCMEQLRANVMGCKIVPGSRLSFASKTAEISRTICTEPVLNMLFQKGIAAALEARLIEVFGIDLTAQPDCNREFARLGSLTGKFGTIDLSSASDTISRGLCDEVLPRRVVGLLNLARCSHTILPNGQSLELHMISSMGNAFTFPLQTLIFAALVNGCYRAYGINPVHTRGNSAHSMGNYAVFGDDIICHERVYSLLVRMLSAFGFTVNVHKSFNEGPFRESCGRDFHNGHDVRGVYLKRLRDVNDCYSAINRLIRWSAKHDVPLYSLVEYLRKQVRFNPIPFEEADDCGIKVPYSMLKRVVKHRETGAVMYRISKLSTRVVSLRPKKGTPKLKGWFANPSGELLAFIACSIRDGSVTLRTNERRANRRVRYSPRWDYIPPHYGESRGYASYWKQLAEWMLTD